MRTEVSARKGTSRDWESVQQRVLVWAAVQGRVKQEKQVEHVCRWGLEREVFPAESSTPSGALEEPKRLELCGQAESCPGDQRLGRHLVSLLSHADDSDFGISLRRQEEKAQSSLRKVVHERRVDSLSWCF